MRGKYRGISDQKFLLDFHLHWNSQKTTDIHRTTVSFFLQIVWYWCGMIFHVSIRREACTQKFGWIFFHMEVDSAPFALFWKLSGNFFLSKIPKNTPKIPPKKRIKKCQIFFSIENDISFQVNIKLAVVEDPTKSIHLALFVLAML